MIQRLERALKVLLDHLNRMDESRREIALATFFLFMLLFAGTFGYVLIEHWSWVDGLYMTFITLTTIGFGEVRELSVPGRFFTIAIGLIGIGGVAFIATRLAQLLLTSHRLREQHMTRLINRLDDHYILCGYGRIGSRIAQDLHRAEKPFVIIELNEAKIEQLETTEMLFIEGDALDEDVLKQAGIERAQGLILTLPDDSVNVFVTLTARELNTDLFILVRTDRHKNHRKLIRAGADKVIAPYEIGADRMAQVILRPNVDRFMERILHTGALDVKIEEVTVKKGSRLAGKSLKESQFRQHFGAIVLGHIEQDNDTTNFNPDPSILINSGDVLIVLGSQEMITKLREKGCEPK